MTLITITNNNKTDSYNWRGWTLATTRYICVVLDKPNRSTHTHTITQACKCINFTHLRTKHAIYIKRHPIIFHCNLRTCLCNNMWHLHIWQTERSWYFTTYLVFKIPLRKMCLYLFCTKSKKTKKNRICTNAHLQIIATCNINLS